MKFVYVLTSSATDTYYEQFFLSITSMRLYNADAEIILLVDEKTKSGLTGKRAGYEKLVSEIKIISVPIEFTQKEASRWIKTSIHHYVSDDFLFVDTDTIITGNIDVTFPPEIKAGAILDTHVTLDTHHLRNKFREEDKKAGFDSSLKTNKRYNGGLIFCRNEKAAREFYQKWHTLWIECRKTGCTQDMPSLNQANYEMGDIITELPGEWNCQISHNGLPYLADAKIIHYFATTLVWLEHPVYKLASPEILGGIKETGKISEETEALLKKPRAAFEPLSRIIADKNIIDALDYSLFFKFIKFTNRHPRFFKVWKLLSIFLSKLLRKIFDK